MYIDISKLDEWLMNNENYSQDEREIIVEAINNYIEYGDIKTKD